MVVLLVVVSWQEGALCLPCSGLRGDEPGHWVRHQSHFRYAVRDCDLQRYDHRAAKQCLSRRHLVLIGDSIVRLQYLSLVYFVMYGSYPEPYGDDLPGGYPNVAQHKSFKTWEETMPGLSEGLFKGKEACDCYRDGQWRHINNISENRYFRMTGGNGDGEDDIRVSFFFDTCMGNVFGHYPIPLEKSRPWKYDPPDWKGQWEDIPSQWKENSQSIEADAVFASCGHWPFLVGKGKSGWTEKGEGSVVKTMKAFQSLLTNKPSRPFSSNRPKVVWRTNFPSQQIFKRRGYVDRIQNNLKLYNVASKVADQLNFHVIDANEMTLALNHSAIPSMKYFYDKSHPCPIIREIGKKHHSSSQPDNAEAMWHNGDGTHPCPWFSEEMNNLLLNILCS